MSSSALLPLLRIGGVVGGLLYGTVHKAQLEAAYEKTKAAAKPANAGAGAAAAPQQVAAHSPVESRRSAW